MTVLAGGYNSEPFDIFGVSPIKGDILANEVRTSFSTSLEFDFETLRSKSRGLEGARVRRA